MTGSVKHIKFDYEELFRSGNDKALEMPNRLDADAEK